MASNSKFLKLSNAGIQMGVIIGGCAWLGSYLDDKYLNEKPWWTLGLTLFGVFAGLYIIIKEVINLSKDESEERGEDAS